MNDSPLVDFATRYTAAWCSHDAARVAMFYSEAGSLTINDGAPAVGRQAVEAAVQSFMSAYSDLVVKFERLEPNGNRVLYHWTFMGPTTGPGAQEIRFESVATRIGRSVRMHSLRNQKGTTMRTTGISR